MTTKPRFLRSPRLRNPTEPCVDRLFVYGTLLRGEPAHAVLEPFARVIAAASVRGSLVQLPAGYPVMAPSDGTVWGELIWLSNANAAFSILDAYEGEQYARVLLPVDPLTGSADTAWCYVARDPAILTAGAPIVGGSWRQRHLQKAS